MERGELADFFSDPDSDPEQAQNSIDFIQRIMSRYPEALLQIQPTSDLEFFFMFTLRVLDGTEPLPKNSACDFWVSHNHSSSHLSGVEAI